MLAFIKSNYQIGDTIEVTCSEGVIAGQIEYVNNKYIVLRQSNGMVCGIAASDIRTFTANSPVPMMPCNGKQATVAPTESDEDLQTEDLNYATTTDADIRTDAEERPQTLRDVLGDEADNIPSADNLTGAAPVAEPKVVGHIDLERLQAIDPRMGRKKYFKSDYADNDGINAYNQTNGYNGSGEHGVARTPYVGARGRITYYNAIKRYGFIHDFNTENDLYFYIQQIAEDELCNELHKGTKVVYSIGRNNMGPIATCVHLPHTVEDTLAIADDQIDARHYYLAKGLIEHVLELFPDNAEAKDMLEVVKDKLPASSAYNNTTPDGIQTYKPCATYAHAKRAYLNKEYDKAEELYTKALTNGERPESCVKDLVTLYVSRYKQAETETEKEAARHKAKEFMSAHRDQLTDSLTTKQFLALNYYLPIQAYDEFIATVDSIMTDPQVANSVARKVFYMWQKAISLNKLGRTDEALELIEKGLELAPFNRQLINLRENILHPETGDAPAQATDNVANDEANAATEAETDKVAADNTEDSKENADNAGDEDAASDNDSPISTASAPWWGNN